MVQEMEAARHIHDGGLDDGLVDMATEEAQGLAAADLDALAAPRDAGLEQIQHPDLACREFRTSKDGSASVQNSSHGSS